MDINTIIFLYLSFFFLAYAGFNSFFFIQKVSLSQEKSYLSTIDIQTILYKLIHKRSDFLSFYYYEFTILFTILNIDLYLYIIYGYLANFLVFINTIIFILLFINIYFSYYYWYLRVAKEAFLNGYDYLSYLKQQGLYIEELYTLNLNEINNNKIKNVSTEFYKNYSSLLKEDQEFVYYDNEVAILDKKNNVLKVVNFIKGDIYYSLREYKSIESMYKERLFEDYVLYFIYILML